MALNKKQKNTLKIGGIAAVGAVLLTIGAIRLAPTPDWLMRSDEKKVEILYEVNADAINKDGEVATSTSAGINVETITYAFEDKAELSITNTLAEATNTFKATNMIHNDSSQGAIHLDTDHEIYMIEVSGLDGKLEVVESYQVIRSVNEGNTIYSLPVSEIVADFSEIETLSFFGIEVIEEAK